MKFKIWLPLLLMFAIFSCSEIKDKPKTKVEQQVQSSPEQNEIERELLLKQQQLKELEVRARVVLDSLQQMELSLVEREASLDSTEQAFKQIHEQLLADQKKTTRLRNAAYGILLLGVLMVAAGLLLIVLPRIKPAKPVKPVEDVKPATVEKDKDVKPVTKDNKKPAAAKKEEKEKPKPAESPKTSAAAKSTTVEGTPAKTTTKSTAAAKAKSVEKKTTAKPKASTTAANPKSTTPRKRSTAPKKNPDENKPDEQEKKE